MPVKVCQWARNKICAAPGWLVEMWHTGYRVLVSSFNKMFLGHHELTVRILDLISP